MPVHMGRDPGYPAGSMRAPRKLMSVCAAGLVCALGGCGGSGNKSSTGASAATSASSTTNASTKTGKTHHRKHAGHGQTTSTNATRAAPPKGKSSKHPVASGGRNTGSITKYSGTGDKALGTIKLARDAVLHWTASGGAFALIDSGHRLKLPGHGARGQAFAAAGTYQQVKVTARGRWTLQIQLLAPPK